MMITYRYLIYQCEYSTELQAFKVVNSSIDKVWEFYTDIKHLEIITPREMKLMLMLQEKGRSSHLKLMPQAKNLPKDQKFGLRLN